MKKDNYKNLTMREAQEFLNQFTEYQIGDLIYAISRELKIEKPKDFLRQTNENYYTAISKLKEKEKDTAMTDSEFEAFLNKHSK
jgi:hypothetical protein